MAKIAVLPGDGIGPEVVSEAIKALETLKDIFGFDLEYEKAHVGGIAIDNHGKALPESTLDLCRKSDAILFGSVGGPKWEHLPAEEQPERGALLPLRKIFDLYYNLRPARVFKALVNASPLKPEIVKDGFEIMCVRELTSGVYFGQPKGREGELDEEFAYDTMRYTRAEVARVAKSAFEIALKRRKQVVSIDKANVLHASMLWRDVVTEVSKDYPGVELKHVYADAATMMVMKYPHDYDLILGSNLFGDVLSDECAMLTGSLGLLASASLNETSFGLFEPAGGSAPDIAGKGIANPIAQIMSVEMMLRYSLGLTEPADLLAKAVESVLDQGVHTQDIATKASQVVNTKGMGDAICHELQKLGR